MPYSNKVIMTSIAVVGYIIVASSVHAAYDSYKRRNFESSKK